MKGVMDKTIADYGNAICLDNKYDLSYINRGKMFSITKDYKRAASDLENALLISPASPEACDALAWLLATCQDPSSETGNGRSS